MSRLAGLCHVRDELVTGQLGIGRRVQGSLRRRSGQRACLARRQADQGVTSAGPARSEHLKPAQFLGRGRLGATNKLDKRPKVNS
jgi:hypothetical protein